MSTPSTAAAQARPSAIAHTTSDAPRLGVAAGVHAVGRGLPVVVDDGRAADGVALDTERVEQLGHVGADETGREQHQVSGQFGARAGDRAELAPARHPHDLDLLDEDAPHGAGLVADELDDLAGPGLVHALVMRGRACRGCSAPTARPG